jgi:hypothetical protein
LPRLSDYVRAFRRPFTTATTIAAVTALPRYDLAGPAGGAVVAGSARISRAGSVTNTNQPSPGLDRDDGGH